MLSSFLSAALLLVGASADSCQLISGNYYCNQVNQVQYTNVGFSGSYNQITAMNSDGQCSSTPYSFSGSLSPFDEELSVHFRGPIKLNQFAVYGKSGSNSRRDVEGEHHVHKRVAEPVYVTDYHSVTYYVTVDQNGNLMTATTGAPASSVASAASVAPAASSVAAAVAPGVGGVNNAVGLGSKVTSGTPTTSGAAASSSASGPQLSGPPPVNYNYNGQAQSSVTGPSTITTSVAAPSSAPTVAGDWTRGSYYNADQGSADNLVFLNNLGGGGSGVFDYVYGNSLSYAGSDGQSCASSSQVLSSTTVPSDKEFIIFTGNQCSGNDCGFYREGIPAYHGFSGNEKIFLFDFEMPTESQAAPGSFNYDMPAIWMLNAQIPRTLQYGNSECSCWSSGCGELDLFEVLNAGNNRLTTTIHDNQDGNGKGSSDFFERPVSGSLKAAVIFDGTSITITTLDSSVDFSSSLDESTIQQWLSSTQSQAGLVAF